MDGNAFLTSLQQLGQYLNQQNQSTGSGQMGLPPSNNGSNPGNISKVVTQVHYDNTPPESGTNMGQPAVAAQPPAPQVSNFAVPQTGGNVAIPQSNVTVPQGGGGGGGQGQGGGPGGAGGAGGVDYRNTPYDPDPDIPYLQAAGMGGAAPGGGMGGNQASSAISGITSALQKGLQGAASAIGNTRTMPTPINEPPIPGINQVAPTLIGRRTQANAYGY